MRKTGMIGIAIAAASMSLGACATNDPYGYDRYGYDNRDRTLGRAAGGAAVGAAAGAGLGAVVGGLGVGEGAALGAIAGGALGAATANDGRTRGGEVRWYRDEYGRCFYMDRDGYRRYDPNVRC